MLCEQESKNVTLHVKDLILDEDNIKLISMKDGKIISITEHTYDQEREFYIAKLSQKLQKGTKYKIFINFTGKLGNNNFGFYYSVYKDRTTGLDEYDSKEFF